MTKQYVSLKEVSSDSISLLDTYRSCFETQAATNEIVKVAGSQYRRLRREAVSMYREMKEKVGGDVALMDFILLREMFNIRLQEQAEELYDGTDEAKAFGFDRQPDVWAQSKSQLGRALERGFDFEAEAEIGQTALRKWISAYDKKKKEQDLQARVQKARDAGLLKDMPQPKAEKAGKKPDGKKVVDDKTAHAKPEESPAPVSEGLDGPVRHLKSEHIARIIKTIDMMDQIASVKGADSVEGMLKGWENAVKQSFAALNKAIEAMAKTGTEG